MLTFLLQSENLPFTVALGVMIGIALMEGVSLLALGAGVSGFLDDLVPDGSPDFDTGIDIEADADIDVGADVSVDAGGDFSIGSAFARALGWLHVGKVPLLILLVCFLTEFGLMGLAIQGLASKFLDGVLLPGWIASIAAFFSALPMTRMIGGIIGKYMPNDETEAVSIDEFIGITAIITVGKAAENSAAEARLKDRFGQSHYIMVEPDIAGETFPMGAKVLVVRRAGTIFRVVAAVDPAA